jgi:hypothetical protein
VEYLELYPGLLTALKSKTSTLELSQAILKLSDPRFRLEDVERALLPLLDHPNSEVRSWTCTTLAQHGSNLWHKTALAIVNDAIQGKPLEPLSLESVTSDLTQYRVAVPKELIIELAKRFPNERSRFVNYTYDELLPWWEEPIRKRQNPDFSYLQTFRRASPDIVARLHAQRPNSTLPPNRFGVDFKLYLVGENPGFFPEIIKMAEIHTGRRKPPPVTDNRGKLRWDTTRLAWEYVLYSNEPAAIELMRSVATELSHDPNRNSMIFGDALGALFYLHRDYAFVDNLLMERLKAGIEHGQKTNMNIVSVYEFQIMAARGNPAFAPLVREYFTEVYVYYFVQSAHVPIERWIGLYRTPHPDTRVAIKGEP